MAGAVSLDRSHFLEPESVLPVLAELSPGDLAVLTDVWDRGMHRAKAYTYKDASPDLPAWVSGNLVFHLLRLQRAGLVKEATGTFLDYSSGNYSPTPTMHKLMSLVDTVGGSISTEGA